MKKVVIFYPHVGEYGGIERNILGYAAGILKKDHAPVLVCFYDKVGMASLGNGLQAEVLGDHWNPLVKAWRLKRYLRQEQDSIQGLPLFFGVKAGFYAALAGLENYALHYTDPPSLLSFAGTVGRESPLRMLRRKISEGINDRGVQRAAKCLTMTAWNARELEAIHGRNFDVISQGGSPPHGYVEQAPRCQGTSLRLFSICRLAGSKNLGWIIETVVALQADPMVGARFPKIHAVIAGKGPEMEALKMKALDLGVQDSISFPGFLTSEELESEYRKADLFVVPGRQGYGLPVLEALYRHVPVLLNRESRISEILEGNHWVAISDDSAESFAETARSFVTSLLREPPDPGIIANLPTEAGWAESMGRYCGCWD